MKRRRHRVGPRRSNGDVFIRSADCAAFSTLCLSSLSLEKNPHTNLLKRAKKPQLIDSTNSFICFIPAKTTTDTLGLTDASCVSYFSVSSCLLFVRDLPGLLLLFRHLMDGQMLLTCHTPRVNPLTRGGVWSRRGQTTAGGRDCGIWRLLLAWR